MSALERVLALAVVVVAGCTSSDRRDPSPPPRPRVVVSSFTGAVRGSDGSLRITVDAPASAAGFVEIPVVQDGRPGSGPDDTVELVTESAGDLAGACGSNIGFQGVVRVRSFHRAAVLKNVYAEITSVTPSGHEGCNSAAPPPGLSDQFGLFAHGTIGRAGTAGDSTAATWIFRHADAQDFTFRGRIVADLVTGDVTPPTVVAFPPAGTYAAAQAVTLSCSDAEAGCQATYYTTSGADPTTASSVYTGPITVSATRTLKFLSVDHAGNASAVQTAAYVIDTVAPSVVSVSPRDGKTNVATGSTIVLTFSEPMQVTTTAAAIALTGPEGPVAGTVTANGAGTTFTFTPTSALAEAARYTVSVGASALDVAGNALPPSGSWFTTPAPVVQVSGATQARYENGGIAYSSAGTGLAVWGTRTLTGFRLVSARYASGTWGTPAVLHATGQQGPAGMTAPLVVKVVSSGAGFLVAWSTGSRVEGLLVDGTGAAGPVLTLLSSVAASWQWAMAAGASGYAVLGADLGTISATVFNGTSWAASTLASEAGNQEPFVAFNGTTYVGGYQQSFGPLHVATYTAANNTWSTTVAVPSTPYAQVESVQAAIAASGNSTCLLFVEGGTVKAAVATTGPLAFTAPYALTVAGATAPSSLAVAVSHGTTPTFAAAWRATVGEVVNAYGATRQAGWNTPSSLEGQAGDVLDVKLASSGSWNSPSFLATMQIQAAAAQDVYVNASTGTAWGSAQLVESGAADASRPAVTTTGAAGAGIVTWDQDDGAGPQLFARTVTNAALGTPAAIGGTPPEGSVKGLRTASRGNGEIMAVWTQDERNDTAVYAAVRTGAGWSTPIQVAARASAPAVASNGSTYLVAYQQWNGTTRVADIAAAEWNGTAFDAAVVLTTSATGPSLASDGLGYAAAWAAGTGQFVASRIREGGTWGVVRKIGPSPYQAALPALGGKSGEYVLVYLERSSYWPMAAQRAIRSGTTWTWTSSLTFAELVYPSQAPTVVGGAGGWAAVWYKVGVSGSLDAAYYAVWTGSAWASGYLESGSWCTIGNPAVSVAALGDGFRFSAACSAAVNGYAWASGTLGPRVSTGQTGYSAVISTDGARYRMLATLSNTTPLWIGAVDWVGETPQSPAERVDTLPSYNSYWGDLALPWDGSVTVGLWTRQQPADLTADRLHARWSP